MQRDPVIMERSEGDAQGRPAVPVVQGTRVVWVVLIGIAAILLGIELMGFRDVVPPRSHTNAAMRSLKERLLMDAVEHGRVVAQLADLPGFQAAEFPFVDGWQRDIGFALEGDRVVLQSLGGDGEAGGVGQDLDLVGIFPLHGPDGDWSDPEVPWIVDPVVPGSAPVEDAR